MTDNLRIGFGYDAHALVPNRPLHLGGIHIPHPFGLQGHSDADVLIHAICDALLGAANLRDIGFHFPSNNNDYKNIDSKLLLQRTISLVHNAGFQLSNIDAALVLQQPILSPYIPAMTNALAQTLQTSVDRLSIKATTTDHLGFTGRSEGIAAYAIALLHT